MNKKFPKTLTIDLPALERGALQEIADREPNSSHAELLEGVLAAGIMSTAARYPDDPVAVPKVRQGTDAVALIEAYRQVGDTVTVHLNAELRDRLVRVLWDEGESRSPAEIAGLMFELGLDAYSESLTIVDSSSTDRDGDAQ